MVKDTVHARWLAAYYDSARITPYDDLAKAGAALKAGEVDVIFGDNLQVIYWVAGEAAGRAVDAADPVAHRQLADGQAFRRAAA